MRNSWEGVLILIDYLLHYTAWRIGRRKNAFGEKYSVLNNLNRRKKAPKCS